MRTCRVSGIQQCDQLYYMKHVCVQRRRTAEDELNMRTVYAEGDLISVSML